MRHKVSKRSPAGNEVSHSMRARAIVMTALLLTLGFGAVIYNLVQYQIINSDYYKNKATNQQLRDETIVPKRGFIYDSNMKTLAKSITVWTITASPAQMKISKTDTALVAKKLSEMLGVDEAELAEKLSSESNFVYIKRKIDQPTATAVTDWITEYNADDAHAETLIAGIDVIEDSKRTYPYSTLASTVLGFTNTDGDGLTGLELYYNRTLKGVEGRIVSAKNAYGYDMGVGGYEAEHAAEDGQSLVLTLNTTVQSSLEKHLGNGVAEHNVANRGVGIVMNVKTGAILGMAVMPDYDLNDPYTLYDTELAATIAAIADETERTTQRQTAQQLMWRNMAVQDVYEPGSVFKVVTAGAALDSGTANLNTSYSCSGRIKVYEPAGYMRCAEERGHGTLNFSQGLDMSCNPYYIQMGWAMGPQVFCNYLQAFGFTEKTGIDMQGEVKSVTVSADNMNQVSLASSSFGQTSTVTPIAMITAMAAAINGGNLVEPYVVQQVLDANGNIIETHQPTVKRQAISEEASAQIRAILEMSVAPGGHNTRAEVYGYRVGGKSGTSQKQSKKEDNEDDELRIASFVGFAPADDPEIAVLIVLDEPHSPLNVAYGGRLAAPIVQNILAEVLPYLGYSPEYTDEELTTLEVAVPNVMEMTVSDAKVALGASGVGLAGKEEGSGTAVTYQYPLAGTKVPRQSVIMLYTDAGAAGTTVLVPNVTGKTVAKATEALKNAGVNIKLEGTTSENTTMQSVTQSIAEGTEVPKGTIVTVDFHDLSITD